MEGILQIILSIVLVAITIGVSLTVLSNFKENLIAQNQTAAAENIDKIGDAVETLVNWMPTIVIIVISALIIGVVFNAFGMGRR